MSWKYFRNVAIFKELIIKFYQLVKETSRSLFSTGNNFKLKGGHVWHEL